MTATPCKGLLISVGGTPNPVAYSIEHHRPDKVIFFASRDSRREVETKVRPLSAHRWVDQELITTPDPQDLMRSMEALTEKLAPCLADLDLSMRDLVVDYTGGTKTMSAALVLATIHQPVRYSYVGGNVRSKSPLRGGLTELRVGRHHRALQQNREGDVEAVIHRGSHLVGQCKGRVKEAGERMHVDGE